MFARNLLLTPLVLCAGLACDYDGDDSGELEFRTEAEGVGVTDPVLEGASAIVIAPEPDDPESRAERICIDDVLDDDDLLGGSDYPYVICDCDMWSPFNQGTVVCYGYLDNAIGCLTCCLDYAISMETDGTC